MATDPLDEFLETHLREDRDEDDYDDLFTEHEEGSTYGSTPKESSDGELLKETPDGTSYLSAQRTSTSATEDPLDGNHVSGIHFNNSPPGQSGGLVQPLSLHGPLSTQAIHAMDPPQFLQPHPTPINLAGRPQGLVAPFISHPVSGAVHQRSHSAAPTTSTRLSAPQGIAISTSAGPLHGERIPNISGRRAVSITPSGTNVPAHVPSAAKDKQPTRPQKRPATPLVDDDQGPPKHQRLSTPRAQRPLIIPASAMSLKERARNFYRGIPPQTWIRMVAQLMEFVNINKLPIIDPHIMLGYELGDGPELMFDGLQMVYRDLQAMDRNTTRKEQLLPTEGQREQPAATVSEGATSQPAHDRPVSRNDQNTHQQLQASTSARGAQPEPVSFESVATPENFGKNPSTTRTKGTKGGKGGKGSNSKAKPAIHVHPSTPISDTPTQSVIPQTAPQALSAQVQQQWHPQLQDQNCVPSNIQHTQGPAYTNPTQPIQAHATYHYIQGRLLQQPVQQGAQMRHVDYPQPPQIYHPPDDATFYAHQNGQPQNYLHDGSFEATYPAAGSLESFEDFFGLHDGSTMG